MTAAGISDRDHRQSGALELPRDRAAVLAVLCKRTNPEVGACPSVHARRSPP